MDGGIEGSVDLGQESGFDVRLQILGRGRERLVKERRHAIGVARFDERLRVLLQSRMHPPSASMSTLRRSEISPRLERAKSVVRVKREQVVHVAAENDALAYAANVAFGGEDTRIGLALYEAPFAKPRQERALPVTANLSHAMYRLLHAAHARSAVGAISGVARPRIFATLHLAL
eukprot:1625216-Pleurochrysis_carterae.AAC.3